MTKPRWVRELAGHTVRHMDALHPGTLLRTQRAILVAIAIALVIATDGAATIAASDQDRDRIALGVTMQDGALSTLDAFSASIGGRRPALWSVSVKWGSDTARHFPTALARGLAARGILPFVWWTPTDPERHDDAAFSYRRIAAGHHDRYIRRFARAARSYGRPILLRFAHEFNGTFFRWAVEGPIGHDVMDFKRAWRRIWRIFAREGASNVRFVWSVVKRRCPGGCNPYREYFPGERFVDYLGFSSYNWGRQHGRWRGMARTYRWPVRRLAEISDKPMIVSETGSAAAGGDKARWIARGYRTVRREMPRIKAIVYTNVDLRGIGHPDWSLRSRSAAFEAYRAIAARPAFRGRLEATGRR